MNENDQDVVSAGSMATATGDISAAGAELGLARSRAYSLHGLFVLGCLFALYFAAPLLVPVIIAVLLSLMLAPVVRLLKRRGLPEPFSAFVIMAAFITLLIVTLSGVTGAAQSWLERVPRDLYRLEEKLRTLKKPIGEITKATDKIESATDIAAERPIKVAVERPGIVHQFMTGTPRVFASLAMVTVLLFMLLASGDNLLRKIVELSPALQDKKRAVEITRAIQQDISLYLFTLTAINATLGLIIGVLTWAMGLPNPELWGVLVFLWNFAPYAGSIAISGILSVVGLLTFDAWVVALIPAAVYLGLMVVVGNFIVPVLLGRKLRLSALAIFLSIMFWGWMWGVVGALVAVPLLASLNIICERITPLKPVAALLRP